MFALPDVYKANYMYYDGAESHVLVSKFTSRKIPCLTRLSCWSLCCHWLHQHSPDQRSFYITLPCLFCFPTTNYCYVASFLSAMTPAYPSLKFLLFMLLYTLLLCCYSRFPWYCYIIYRLEAHLPTANFVSFIMLLYHPLLYIPIHSSTSLSCCYVVIYGFPFLYCSVCLLPWWTTLPIVKFFSFTWLLYIAAVLPLVPCLCHYPLCFLILLKFVLPGHPVTHRGFHCVPLVFKIMTTDNSLTKVSRFVIHRLVCGGERGAHGRRGGMVDILYSAKSRCETRSGNLFIVHTQLIGRYTNVWNSLVRKVYGKKRKL